MRTAREEMRVLANKFYQDSFQLDGDDAIIAIENYAHLLHMCDSSTEEKCKEVLDVLRAEVPEIFPS